MIDMEAIRILRAYFSPPDGYSDYVIDGSSEDHIWRLDLFHDSRMYDKMMWMYQEWDKDNPIPDSCSRVVLTDDEVLGYMKAKHPQLNVRKEIVEATIKKLNRVISEIKKCDLHES